MHVYRLRQNTVKKCIFNIRLVNRPLSRHGEAKNRAVGLGPWVECLVGGSGSGGRWVSGLSFIKRDMSREDILVGFKVEATVRVTKASKDAMAGIVGFFLEQFGKGDFVISCGERKEV
ncbi:hypothetical protein Tco_0094122 [Tanacetum coccineum]